jgi:23S rRNA pseudouridine1911/1915/1917 synthase
MTHRYDGPPRRFERVLRELAGGISRPLARRLIAEGAATVNGRVVAKGTVVRAGDEIDVPVIPPLAAEPELPVAVVAENDAVAVLDKPAPMPTLPLDPRERGTLASFVVATFPECRNIGGPLTAGIAHRLDTASSGVVLAARTPAIWHALRALFAARRIEKHYVAIVAGRPRTGVIDLPLAHAPGMPGRMIGARPGLRAWPAETRVERVQTAGTRALVWVSIRTGVTHQVRAHLALTGSPVVGDLLYDGPADAALPDRHALHAERIVVPARRGLVGGEWSSPLPARLAALA